MSETNSPTPPDSPTPQTRAREAEPTAARRAHAQVSYAVVNGIMDPEAQAFALEAIERLERDLVASARDDAAIIAARESGAYNLEVGGPLTSKERAGLRRLDDPESARIEDEAGQPSKRVFRTAPVGINLAGVERPIPSDPVKEIPFEEAARAHGVGEDDAPMVLTVPSLDGIPTASAAESTGPVHASNCAMHQGWANICTCGADHRPAPDPGNSADPVIEIPLEQAAETLGVSEDELRRIRDGLPFTVKVPLVPTIKTDLDELLRFGVGLANGLPEGKYPIYSREVLTAVAEIERLRARVAEAIADEKRTAAMLDQWERGHRVLNAALASAGDIEAKLRTECARLRDRLAAMTIPPLDRGPVTHAESSYRPGEPACGDGGMRAGDGMVAQIVGLVDCQACKDAIAMAEAMRGNADAD